VVEQDIALRNKSTTQIIYLKTYCFLGSNEFVLM